MTCDHKGCRCRSYEYVGDNKRTAHKVARSEGWQIGKIGEPDLCKDHKRTAQRRFPE